MTETFKTPNGKPLQISRKELLKQSTTNIKFWTPFLKQKGWITQAKTELKFWRFMLKQAKQPINK